MDNIDAPSEAGCNDEALRPAAHHPDRGVCVRLEPDDFARVAELLHLLCLSTAPPRRLPHQVPVPAAQVARRLSGATPGGVANPWARASISPSMSPCLPLPLPLLSLSQRVDCRVQPSSGPLRTTEARLAGYAAAAPNALIEACRSCSAKNHRNQGQNSRRLSRGNVPRYRIT